MARTFYHNTAINPATMNFNFAHVYSNRYEMDTKRALDGIYPGRYVLVDYDKAFEPVTRNEDGSYSYANSYSYKYAYSYEYSNDGLPNNWTRITTTDGKTYTVTTGDTFLFYVEGDVDKYVKYSTKDTWGKNATADAYELTTVTKDTVIFVQAKGPTDYTLYFYQALEGTEGQPAEFRKLNFTVQEDGLVYLDGNVIDPIAATKSEIYGYNYAVDKDKYFEGIGRGYDSTVWQKTVVDGKPKYVQIAELNTVTPTFDLRVDAPSENGTAPYFDEISSNVYYRIHDTAHWGFRVKGAEGHQGYGIDEKGNEITPQDATQEAVMYPYSTDTTIYPSDEDVSWKRRIHGMDQYFNGELDTWEGDSRTNLEGAIYFNKDGFDKDTIHYSNDIIGSEPNAWTGENSIAVTATGQSGRIYDGKDSPTPDIQELSIMLPALGDTVAELWDIAYGGREINEINWNKSRYSTSEHDDNEYTNTRETEISWHDANESDEAKTKGLRLVDYVIGPDETYAHRPESVATLAGCINSVHDLMGMIIHDGNNTENPIDLLDQDTLDNLSSDYIYYVNGKYYRRGIETELNPDYDPNELYKPINVIEYNENEKYFYKDLTNYKRLIGEPNSEIPYYQFTNESEDMKLQTDINVEFQNGRYYYTVGSSTVDVILETDGYHDDRNYYDLTFTSTGVAFYQADKYYLPADPSQPIGENNSRHPNANESPFIEGNENTRYYYLYKYSRQNPETHSVEYVNAYQGILGSQLTQWESGRYFEVLSNGNYHLLTEPIFYSETPGVGETVNIRITVAEVTPNLNEARVLKFYVPNKYYYKSPIGGDINTYDYYLDSNPRKTADRDYYLLLNNLIKVDKFYEPNRYYYNDGEKYIKDESLTYTNQQYYERLDLYVIEDETGQYRIGSAWNPELGYGDDTPEGVTLGTKSTRYRAYELVGFARNLNTIHGMLIKINALLNTDDVLTRNTDTVQGCINYLNDIIDLFGGLKPNSFNIVNDKGKIVSADAIDDDWIAVAVDGATRTASFTHEFTAVQDTTSTSNVNGNGDTIELYTPKVDAKGHVVGKNTETVTLPFGFKKLRATAQSEDDAVWSTAAQSTDITIEADNTQDELTFTTGNKWLRVSTDTANDKLTLAHETHQKTTSTTTQNLSDESGITTFNVYNYTFDAAGHVDNEDIKTITMPASYGKISGDSGNTTATATLDTLNILGTDNWIQTAVTTDQVSITHEAPVAVTPTAKSNDTPQFGSTFTIEDWSFDGKGHKNGLGTHTVTIPQLNLATATLSPNSDSNVLVRIGLSDVENATGKTITPQEKYVGDLYLNNFLPATGTNHYYDNYLTISQFAGATDTNFDTINTNLTAVNQNLTSRINDTNTRVDTIVNTTIPAAIQTAEDTATRLINTLKGPGLNEAFDTLKEIQDWISDGNSEASALVTRVATLESSLGDLSGSGSGSVSSQISSAINTYDSSKNFGDIITHNVSEFESAGAAATVQGNTTTTVAGLETSLNNYVLKSEATGYDDILTATNAAATYQPLLTAGVDYVEPNDIDDMVETTTEFAYVYGDTSTDMTIDDLMTYIATLEARIEALENAGTDPEPSGGGEEPEPQTPTRDVEIEVVSGAPTLIKGTFADAYTDASGTPTYNYSVTVDNVATTVESVTAEAIGEPAVETIHIYLDNTGDYYLDWTANDLTLIDNRE